MVVDIHVILVILDSYSSSICQPRPFLPPRSTTIFKSLRQGWLDPSPKLLLDSATCARRFATLTIPLGLLHSFLCGQKGRNTRLVLFVQLTYPLLGETRVAICD